MRAVLYARCSSSEQALEGVTLEAQEARMRAYADLYGIEIVGVIVDAGQSAKSLNRSGLQVALTMLESGQAEAIVINKLDRLTRSVSDWAILIDTYFSKRFALLSVADQIDTRTASGRMVLNLLVCVSQWEREAIGERTSQALCHLKSTGMHVGGIPWGHEILNGRLVVKQTHAHAISLVHELRSSGYTLQRICDELDARQIPTARGGRWFPMTVKKILARAV